MPFVNRSRNRWHKQCITHREADSGRSPSRGPQQVQVAAARSSVRMGSEPNGTDKMGSVRGFVTS